MLQVFEEMLLVGAVIFLALFALLSAVLAWGRDSQRWRESQLRRQRDRPTRKRRHQVFHPAAR
jgi:uncharacterized protein HemY